MLAACGLASGGTVTADALLKRWIDPADSSAYSAEFVGKLTRGGRRNEFAAMLTRLRAWLGEPFIAFAVEQTSRVFEQVLVEQASALPRF